MMGWRYRQARCVVCGEQAALQNSAGEAVCFGHYLAAGLDGLARPVEARWPISQGWGEHPEWYAKFGFAGHNGIDYACPVGTPVRAAHGGKASTGMDPQGFGLYVKVVDGSLLTIYAHLSRVGVGDGDWLRAGDGLGLSGSTGGSTGPHLHFGVKVGGGWVDPAKLLLP